MRALLILVLLAGCDIDPLTRKNDWHPIGANERNLHAMIADPYDLVNGAADPTADGAIAAAAVARYRTGKVKALPDSGVARIAPIAFGGSSGAPAAAAAE